MNVLCGERRLHLGETGANRTVKKLIADMDTNTTNQFRLNSHNRVKFDARELLGKRLKQAVKLSGASLKADSI